MVKIQNQIKEGFFNTKIQVIFYNINKTKH